MEKPINALSDQELVALSLSDSANFAYLITRYKERFFCYLKRLSGLDNDRIEDVIQDSFIKIYYHLNDFDAKLKFSSWAYRIVHNQAMDDLRRRHNRDLPLLDDFDVADTSDLCSDIDKILEKEKIALVINGLEEKYRQVLILRYLENLDYQEISDILEKPLGTVSTLIKRAKERFKNNYQKYA